MATGANDVVCCSASALALGADILGGLQPLTIAWTILAGPDTNLAQFDDPTAAQPNFTTSMARSYSLQVA